MARYVALLRAVNVGGTGKLPMAELVSICRAAGLARIETYIASGNVVFDSDVAASVVKAELEGRLHAHAGKSIGVMVRSAAQMQAILRGNPFPSAQVKYTHVIFLPGRPPSDALRHAIGRDREEMRLGRQEIYVHYPRGMGGSKLRIPAAKDGTARNMNTVSKLAAMAAM